VKFVKPRTLRLLPPGGEPCERAGRGRTVTCTSRRQNSHVHEPIVIIMLRLPEGKKSDRRPYGPTSLGLGHDRRVLIVRATRKLLDRIGPPSLDEGEQCTTVMGQWYATAMFWKPQVALFVSEPTLLPVLMPLAPAATLLVRLPQQLAAVLAAHGTQTRSSMRNSGRCAIVGSPRPRTAASSGS
jgi:hypothetical protein